MPKRPYGAAFGRHRVQRGLRVRRKVRPYVRRHRRGTRPRNMTGLVKNIAFRLSEAKRRDYNHPFGTGSLAHDALYEVRLNDTDQAAAVPTRLTIGAGPNSRVGDEVYSTGFMVRGCVGLPFDRRNVTVKIWLVEYNSNQGTPTNQADWFRNVTGNNMLDPINDDKFPGVKLLKVLRHKARDLYVERGELTDAGSIASVYYKMWIPWRRKLRYDGTTDNVTPRSGCKERLSLIITAYDTASSLTTDVVAVDCRQSVTWYYRDP